MGKAKKIKVSKSEIKQPKIALGDQIEEEKNIKSKKRQKIKIRNEDDDKVKFIIFLFHKIFKNFNVCFIMYIIFKIKFYIYFIIYYNIEFNVFKIKFICIC